MKRIYAPAFFLLFPLLVYAQSNCNPSTSFSYLDINDVKARINNGGDMWWDLINNAVYVVPKTGNTSSMFAGSLWIGGIDAGGGLHMAAQTYRQTGNDYFPGPLDQNGNASTDDCTNFDRIWKVNKSTIDSFKAGLFGTASSGIPASILQWPGRSNPFLTFAGNRDLGPFVDVNGDGIYDPTVGDYPDVPGDQALWWVFNDAGDIHGETGGLPLGVEVQALAYAFKGSDPSDCLYNTTFYHFKIINKSTLSYNNAYVGWWNDPDLGCYTDDYLGCDTTHQLAVVYNSEATDGGAACEYNYGSKPPIEAIQLLQGPTDENGKVHGMDRYIVYDNDFSLEGNPENAQEYYDYLNAEFKDGSHLSFNNQPVNYAFTGDPSDAGGWSMCAEKLQPGDSRSIVSSGPFSFNSGDFKTLDFAVIWTQDVVYPCPSFAASIDPVADCVKSTFENNAFFTGINPVKSPSFNLSVTPEPVKNHQEIIFQSNQILQSLKIWNAAGSLVNEFSSTNKNIRFDVHLAPGIYFYQVQSKNQKIATGKFIVQ